MLDDIKKDATVRMQKCIQMFQVDLKKLRTGRAHPSFVENLKVDFYGSESPLSQVANIAIEDARTIVVTPWDKTMVGAIEKAIHKSDLNLTPMSAGSVIRIPLPPLTEERRRDLVKQAKSESEDAKIGIRNVRKDANTDIKKLEKEGTAEDFCKKAEEEVQNLTNAFIKKVDELLSAKEAEIMKV